MAAVAQLVQKGRHAMSWRQQSDIEEGAARLLASQSSAGEEEVAALLGATSGGGGGTKESVTEPVLLFSASEFFADELEKTVTIHVWRVGPKTGTTTVRYSTRDLTAIADVNYRQCSGLLTFDPGEAEKSIEIELVHDFSWTNTLDFVVDLNPGSAVGGTINETSRSAKIRVANQDPFPSAKYFNKDGSAKPDDHVLVHYFKMQWAKPDIRVGTIKMLLVAQCHNMYLILKLFVQVYLLDQVLRFEGGGSTEDEHQKLVMCVLAMLLPAGLLHYMDYRKTFFGVSGKSRKVLQSALVRRYMSYERHVHRQIDPSDVMMATMQDAERVVSDGYMNLIDMLEILFQLVSIFLYQLISPLVLNHRISLAPLLPFFVFPVCLSAFFCLRRSITTSALQKRHTEFSQLGAAVNHTLQNFQLIVDYNSRQEYMERFEGILSSYGSATSQLGRVMLNNSAGPDWLTLICLVGYIYIAGRMRLQGIGQDLGVFITNLQIITKMGKQWGRIYLKMADMHTVTPALNQIVRFLNLPVDTSHRRELAKEQHRMTKVMRAELRARGSEGVTLDVMPIMLRELHLGAVVFSELKSAREEGMRGTSSHLDLCSAGSLDIPQGKLVAIAGPPGEGKSTLLNIISGTILYNVPSAGLGSVFVPAHCRRLNVTDTPLFFHGTLIDNLSMGLHLRSEPPPRERIEHVLRKLGVPESVMDYLDSTEALKWDSVFSTTQQALLNIARALIANYEVICIHKAIQDFPEEVANRTMKVLEEHVQNRGIYCDNEATSDARKRTVLFTAESTEAMAKKLPVDGVLYLSNRSGVRWETRNWQDGKEDECSPMRQQGSADTDAAS